MLLIGLCHITHKYVSNTGCDVMDALMYLENADEKMSNEEMFAL